MQLLDKYEWKITKIPYEPAIAHLPMEKCYPAEGGYWEVELWDQDGQKIFLDEEEQQELGEYLFNEGFV